MIDFAAVASRKPLKLHPPIAERHKNPNFYKPAEGLREALDIAMFLGSPLLLTGAPGTGKTRAAYWLNSELSEKDLLRFNVKSTSTGADLLYSFDEVARFRDAAAKVERPLVDYLRLNPLGEAIVRAAGGSKPLYTPSRDPLEGDLLREYSDVLDKAFGKAWRDAGAANVSLLRPLDSAFAAAAPEHRIVLIDELDKAPRDTPNDLLVEVEEMEFLIPELGVMVVSDPGHRPIVIITSNSEKSFPDPFLRRCAYFDIPNPEPGDLKEIIERSVSGLAGGDTLVSEALELFELLRREDSGIRKIPGTSELLAWLDLLVRWAECAPDTSLRERAAVEKSPVSDTLVAVFKTKEDKAAARRILANWVGLG